MKCTNGHSGLSVRCENLCVSYQCSPGRVFTEVVVHILADQMICLKSPASVRPQPGQCWSNRPTNGPSVDLGPQAKAT